MALIRRKLITVDGVRTSAGLVGDAVLIAEGKVVEVGAADSLRGPDLFEESQPGAVLVPGLGDAHIHPFGYATAITGLNVNGAADFDDLVQMVATAAGELPPGTPILGTRLDDESLAERRLPTRLELDRASPDRPVLLHRYCGHLAVANTAALEAASVGPDTPDPAGGIIDRDESGAATGVLRETAVKLVAGPLGKDSSELAPEQVIDAISGLAGLGLTRLGAIVSVGAGLWGGVADEVATLAEIAPDLPMRLHVLVIAATPAELENAADRLGSSGRVRFLGLKEFADGALGSHTAAMAEPFADRMDTRGTMRLPPNVVELARCGLDLGGLVALHAIGDRANRRVLDIFESLRQQGAPGRRLRVEHASVIAGEDVQRLAATGATASVQPAFLTSEVGWLEKRLGAERMRRVYPFRSLADAGVPLAGGSDSPVETPDPLWGMAAARDRAGIVPEESLSGSEALAAYTDGVARALGLPEPLTPGSPADFTLLDRDPVIASPDELRKAAVVSVWVDGEPVRVQAHMPAWQA